MRFLVTVLLSVLVALLTLPVGRALFSALGDTAQGGSRCGEYAAQALKAMEHKTYTVEAAQAQALRAIAWTQIADLCRNGVSP